MVPISDRLWLNGPKWSVLAVFNTRIHLLGWATGQPLWIAAL
jgi:hypothetical protein